MAKRLSAKPIVKEALQSLKQRVQILKQGGLTPALKVILLGDHPPSLIYTRNKKRFCEEIGAVCEILHLEGKTDEDTLRSIINQCNEDTKVHGCLIQFPLPPHLSHVPVGKLVIPEKDVDGFHMKNIEKIYQGSDESKVLAPCTPKGIIKLLKYYDIEIASKHVTIIGRSHIVGRPLSLMMTNHDATVTLCHSKSQEIRKLTTASDIIIVAVGRRSFLDSSFIGPNRPVVIDVGTNVIGGKLCGDVQFEEIQGRCSAVTPVPGGVGPLTILLLAENLILSAERTRDS